MDTIPVVNHDRVPAEEDVPVAAGRSRQAAGIVIRNRVDHSPHVPIQHISFSKPGFILRT